MSKIVTAKELSLDHIHGVLSGEILALRIPDYCDPEACHILADQVIEAEQNDLTANYNHEMVQADGTVKKFDYRVKRFGAMPFNEVVANDAKLEQYLKEAEINNRTMRVICSPHLTPMQQLTRDFQRVWPGGAETAKWDGHEMSEETVRLTLPNAKRLAKLPHIDRLIGASFNIFAQLTANGHVQTPGDDGGLGLRSFPRGTSPEHVKRLEGLQGEWARAVMVLDEEILYPHQYDMVIHRTDIVPHRVGEYRGEPLRITDQCFWGVADFDQPMRRWV